MIGPSAHNVANEFPSSLTERKDVHFSACFCKDAWYDPCPFHNSNFSRLAIIRWTLFSVNQFELECWVDALFSGFYILGTDSQWLNFEN